MTRAKSRRRRKKRWRARETTKSESWDVGSKWPTKWSWHYRYVHYYTSTHLTWSSWLQNKTIYRAVVAARFQQETTVNPVLLATISWHSIVFALPSKTFCRKYVQHSPARCGCKWRHNLRLEKRLGTQYSHSSIQHSTIGFKGYIQHVGTSTNCFVCSDPDIEDKNTTTACKYKVGVYEKGPRPSTYPRSRCLLTVRNIPNGRRYLCLAKDRGPPPPP